MQRERTGWELLSLGVSPDMSRESARRVRLLNRLTLLGIAYTCAGQAMQAEPLDPVLLGHWAATVAGLVGVFALHATGRRRAAALLFHAAIVGSIVLGSWTVGFDSGNFFFLILCAATPFLLFPSREQAAALATALVATGCLIAVVVGGDLDGDIARRVGQYGPFFLVGQGLLALVTVSIGYGLRSLNALAEEELEREREKSDRLLANVFPAAIAARLQAGETEIAERFGDASVMFCTVIGLERGAAESAAERFMARLHAVFARIDRRCAEVGAETIKTSGMTYVAVAGLPSYRTDHAEALVRLALALQQEFAGEREIGLRIGINSGPVVAGVIGRIRPTFDIWGDTVNMAQRMEMHGAVGEVHVSRLTFAKVNHRFECSAHEVAIKGKGAMRTYVVRGARGGAKA